MPKILNTRKKRARKLLERLVRGPVFDCETPIGRRETPSAQYKLWVETWIVDEVKDLIPELREKKKGK